LDPLVKTVGSLCPFLPYSTNEKGDPSDRSSGKEKKKNLENGEDCSVGKIYLRTTVMNIKKVKGNLPKDSGYSQEGRMENQL